MIEICSDVEEGEHVNIQQPCNKIRHAKTKDQAKKQARREQNKQARQETFFFFSKKSHTQKAVDLAQKAAKRILFRPLADLFSRCLQTLFTHEVISTYV
jgi:hypothetical protein